MTDWPVKTLGDLLEVSIGGIWGSEAGEDEVDVFVYRSTELIKDGQLKEELTVRRSITARQLDSRKLEEGDLLLEKSGGGPKTPVGRVGLVKVLSGLSVCSNFMQLMRPRKKEVLPVYLHYFLNHFHVAGYTEDLQNNSTNIRNLKTTEYMEVEVPLPPLDEQKRIVELLDAATARVTELTACYEQARTHANNLFTSALSSALEGNPDWPVKTLGDISEISYGYTESAKSEAVGPKFLRITDIKDRGVNWDDVPYCPIDDVQLNRHRLGDGDIVFARTGATTGKSFLVAKPPLAVCASYLIRLRTDKKMVSPDFLNLNFQTNAYWKQVNEGMSGAAQGGFNASKLGALEIPVPPLDEQKQIVARLDLMRAKISEMISAYDAKSTAAKNLRQSILEAAFIGQM
jgi:type I restriction enzyme S subunit